MCDDDEAKAVDYLARIVIETRKIGPIGFVLFDPKPQPVSKPRPSSSASPRRSRETWRQRRGLA